MPNVFVTMQELARMTLPRLIENLVFPNLVHRDYSQEFVNGKGDTIQVRKPVVLTANEFDETNGTSAQAINEATVPVKLNHLATVDVELSALQSATNVDDINRIFVEPAAVALAQKINSDGLFLYKDVPTCVGTAGTTISDIAGLSAVRERLNLQNVPEAGRIAVWDPAADAKLCVLDAILHADKSGSTDALREANLGRVLGITHHKSQAVKKHTKGTLAAGGTSGKITVKTAITTAANKVILDVTASANGTLTGTLNAGDILTIDGKTYAVTADAEAAANEIEVYVYPPITVEADKEVTVLGNHTANLAFNPAAFAFVTRPLVVPKGVEAYVTSWNGVTMRVVRGYDMIHKKELLSMDVLYGYKTMYPEMATRVLG